VLPGDFTVHTAPALLDRRSRWAELMPAPQVLAEDLVEEGRSIPVARVAAMHEGKRRARVRRATSVDDDTGDPGEHTDAGEQTDS
jgi:bifunctional non-homologous end joining protein LigD